MTSNTERGMYLIDLLPKVYDMVVACGGKVKQHEGSVSEDITCGTPACFFGWVAVYYQTGVNSYGERSFMDGTRRLAVDLGFRCYDDFLKFVRESDCWPEYARNDGEVNCIQFNPTCSAYESGWYADCDEVFGTHMQFAWNLVAKGD